MKTTIKKSLLGAVCLAVVGAYSANAAFLVAESSSGKAELYGSNGTHLSTFATGLSTPLGVAEGGGFVFISTYGNDMINKYSPSGTSLGVVNSSATGHGPAGLAFINGRIQGAAFNISYLTSSGPDPAAEDGNPATPLSYLFYTPFVGSVHGLASAAPNGFSDIVYYTGQNGANGTLGYWQPGVDAGTIYDFGATTVRGVVAGGSNTMYVAMYDLNKVVKMTFSDGGWTASDFITDINNPIGLAIDGNNIYVSSFLDQTISGYSLVDASFQSSFNTLGAPQYFIVTAVPEPGSVSLLMATGLGALVWRRRRQA